MTDPEQHVEGTVLPNLEVVVGEGFRQPAALTKNGIKYKKKLLVPVEMEVLQQTSGGAAGTLGGAAIGGLLLGGAGAVVGALAGGRGKVAVNIRMRDGQTLLCLVSSSGYPELYQYVERFKNAPPASEVAKTNAPRFPWLAAFLTGPFFFARFGLIACLIAFLFVPFTWFVGWLALPFVARMLWKPEPVTSQR